MVGSSAAPSRTVMSFDYGLARIGVAVGQEITATAYPLATLATRAQQPNWDAISQLIAAWKPDLLVVGIPRHADGSANAVTEAILRFCEQLQDRYGLAVETVDERLSSHEAGHRIAQLKSVGCQKQRRGRAALDQVAAAVILETWLNNQLNQQRNMPRATGH